MHEVLQDDSFGHRVTEGFGMLAFEEDGFSNEGYNGVSNYERLETNRTEIPLLKYVSDPFVELLSFIDNIDNPQNAKRALFAEEDELLNKLFLDQEDPEGEEISDPYVQPGLIPDASQDQFPGFDLPDNACPAPLPDEEN